MSAGPVERLERLPLPLEEFLALPEGVRAEYLDGTAIVNPPADIPHQALAGRLLVLLSTALPDLVVVAEAGLRTVRDGHRIPDLMVLEAEEDSVWAVQRPVLVVEIISRSTRTEDMLRKPGEYAAAGVGQYWLVDRDARTLTVIEHTDEIPTVVLEIDEDRPAGEVRVADHGVVALDLRQLLPR